MNFGQIGFFLSSPITSLDASIIAYDNCTNPPRAHIEYKGPRGLEDFRNVFRARSEETCHTSSYLLLGT